MPYTNNNWGVTNLETGQNPSMDNPTTGNENYATANDFGADYSVWGNIGNFFTGMNAEAEQTSNAYNTALTNAFNAGEAQKARNWAERMDNTKYQRMVQDAKQAGINPLYLVGSNTSTASASSGANGMTAPSMSSKAAGTDLADTLISAVKIAAGIKTGNTKLVMEGALTASKIAKMA